jgi:hypothetical protein
MSERVGMTNKKSEVKKGDSFSRIRKNDSSRSKISPVDHVLFLQRTIGNQAVQRLINNVHQQSIAGSDKITEHAASSPEELGQATLRSWRASNNLWYFNGERHKEPLSTKVTLQAESKPAGFFLWSVTEGTDKVELVDGESGTNVLKTDDNQVEVKSKSGSNGADDVGIRVSHMTADGTPTGTYEGKLGVRTPATVKKVHEQTTHHQVPSQQASYMPESLQTSPDSVPSAAPKSLRHVSTNHSAHATWGYETRITYEVLDDKGNPIKGFDVNEKWTTGVVNDYPKADWRRGPEGGTTSAGTTFFDNIQGESKGHTPAPQNPQKPLGTTKVQHWGQDWYIGSTTPGKGTKVQTNTLQKYQDHAEHQNIKSPP